MKSKFASLLLLIAVAAITGFAQVTSVPPPPPASSPTPPVSEQLSKILESVKDKAPAPREQREMAYAKLLEGQRYIWSGDRLRSRAGRQNSARLAREAFRKSVELNPMLSEGYTALAELAINAQPQDPDEAIRLALLGTRVNPNNFGSRRILARLYTFKSRLVSGPFEPKAAQDAITEWRQIVRLDPRNAEAWALLSELYDKTGNTDESIDALRKWLASAAPVDTRFYQLLTGGQNLAPENASIKLGSMLLKAGRTREAVEALSMLIADEPGNFAAVDLLRDAIEEATPEAAALAVESLSAAVNSNPSNVTLITLLARVQAKAGRIDDAAKGLKESSAKLLPTDRGSAAGLQIGLGDMMARADRLPEALAAYEAAFTARGLDQADTLSDDEREFSMHVFEKMIQLLKNANRTAEAKTLIERSRRMLGKGDLFADRQLIALYRETGNRGEALAAVRSVRQRVPKDYGFLRLEATLLAETGKVDEGVALVRKLMETSSPAAPVPNPTSGGVGNQSVTIAVPAFDAFSNYLFISNLYSQANRGKEAAEAANQAYAIARGAERKQIARLTLATAQQMSGDFKGAEATLRELLKETPGNPIALNNLGYFLVERNERIEEAFDLIQQAVKVDPTNPSYLDSLGWAYFKLGKLPEAEKSLKEALRFDSSSGTIHEHLGDVYHKQGKMDLAKSSWSKAASLFSDATDVTRVKKKMASGK
jgi:tetratricopeptide (TPR) repeat protein